jgi:diguanylate cyclase (GGDEF)-like protein/PAS domain S-box-containing protein
MNESIESLKTEVASLKQKIKDLQHSRSQMRLVISSTGVGIWDWNVQTGETEFNDRWAYIIGYSLAELAPVSIQTWLTHAHPDDLKESERLLKEHWSGKSDYYIFESRMKHKDGHWVWVLDTGKVIVWESEGVPNRMIGTSLDITERKQLLAELSTANLELETLSLTDPLTLIPNRRAYDQHLLRETANARRSGDHLSILMIDIDNFKSFNDNYGHHKGDIALARVAQAISTSLPRATDFVARYGGEEFVVILAQTDKQGAINVANHILAEIVKQEIKHDYSKVSEVLTVSIGIYSTCNDYEELIERADEALYLAKANGKNRFEVYDPSSAA